MSVQRTAYVMVGQYFKDSPFDFEDEAVERLMCKGAVGEMAIIGVDPMSDSSIIVGQIIATCDEFDDNGLTVIDLDLNREDVQTAIIELGLKPDTPCLIEDIKVYSWMQYH